MSDDHIHTSTAGMAITIRRLTKRYGHTTVLDDLDLDVHAGEVHGFLGPNGAGKSTTIRVLLGELRRDSGEVAVLGLDPWKDAVPLHRRLAYVPGDVDLWPNLTGGETLDLLGRLHGSADRARRDDLIARFGLDVTKKGRAYSKGNRQKVALIAALASDAELFLLDEPTSGLDPLMEAEFQKCIREAAHRGATVLLSSHILAEVEALADRISVIRDGRVVETGTLDEMRHLSRTTVTVRAGDAVPPGSDAVSGAGATALHDRLEQLPGVHDLRVDGDHTRCDVDSEELGEVMRVIGQYDVRGLTAAPPTLEQLLLRHYGAPHGKAREKTHGKASGKAHEKAQS